MRKFFFVACLFVPLAVQAHGGAWTTTDPDTPPGSPAPTVEAAR